MDAVEHIDTAVLHLLPRQRRAGPHDSTAGRRPDVPQDEVAKVVRALDEAREFARALWVVTPLDVKFTLTEVRGGLPSWIPRP